MTQTPEQLPTLLARDLKGFERNRVHLIREMEDAGWRGRRSNRNHIIMRSPDGEFTTAISRRVISKNDQHNVERDFRWWQRQQARLAAEAAEVTETAIHAVVTQPDERPAYTPDPEPVREPEPEPVDTTEDATSELPAGLTCEDCGKVFATRQRMSVHHVRAHVRVGCPVCDRPLPPGNLPRHIRLHEAAMGDYVQVMRQLHFTRLEAEQLATEVAVLTGMAEDAEAESARLRTGLRDLIGE